MLKRLPIFILALLWGGLACANTTSSAHPLQLRQGEFLISVSDTPPAENANWQTQALPDIWLNNHPSGLESGWYRFLFQMPQDSTTIQAVYLPKLDMNATFWLNGMLIGDGGRMSDPLSRNWNRPLIFPIPPAAIRSADNILHIHLRGNAYTQPALFPLFVGAEAPLRQAHERKFFLNITVNQIASALIIAVGLLMLSLWWRRKQEVAYGYFGVSALLWAVQSTNLTVRDVPFINTTAQWEIVVNGSFPIIAALLLSSLLRFIGMWRNAYQPWFLTLLLAAPLTLILVPSSHFLKATSFWHLATLAATLFSLIQTIKAALSGNREARLLVGALALILLFALHDWALHSSHLWRSPDNGPLNSGVHLLQYGAPVLFMAIGWIMTSRYLRTLDEFERLNNELDQRVRDKQAELQANYSRMQQLEMEHAVASERERIHGDLRDDVGAKLLSLVYRADNAENAELARSALQDLRDVVSQTSVSTGLAELAADWRAECDKRLTEAHIHLDWDEQGELASAPLTQPQALNLTRIVREAVSNIIRHSSAQTGFVRLRCTQDRLTLEISDNGKGCPHTHNPGRGLSNMAARAQKLGGKLAHYTPPDGGHGVQLKMPLTKTAA